MTIAPTPWHFVQVPAQARRPRVLRQRPVKIWREEKFDGAAPDWLCLRYTFDAERAERWKAEAAKIPRARRRVLEGEITWTHASEIRGPVPVSRKGRPPRRNRRNRSDQET